MSDLSAPEFARLDRFLRAHESRFALALVRIPQIPLREKFARRVEEFSREHGRFFHRFELAGLKPVEAWGRIEAGLPPGAVAMLDGLDAAFHEPDGDMASLLNRQRERIAELLPGPVLLVLGDRAMNRFLADAPDLADWYAASFEFEIAVSPAGPKVEETAIPERSSEWIESRIALLQDQLRSTLRDRTRARVLMELADLYGDSVYGVPSHPDRPRQRNAPENLAAAEAALRAAVDLLSQLARGDPASESQRELARALNALGRLLRNAGRYAEAESLVEEALRIRERVLGWEDPSTLISVNSLAILYESQGRYMEAEPLYHRALAASERVLGGEHPDTLTSVNNLAALYASEGRYAEAEPLYQRALAARERVLGWEHPNTLASVNNLAHLYANEGRYAEAEPLYQRALAACERVLGSEHPNTLTSVNNLAELYASQGRYAEAEPLFQRALAARERVFGKEHPNTLTSVNNLADLYASQGRYAEAEPLLRRNLAASERVLGEEHPNTLGSVNNLAGLYARQGRYTEAEPLYQRAVKGGEKVLGHEHPSTKRFRGNLEALRSDMSSA
jgi:tetratricopeptide (TPR) repeat protein